MKIAIVVADFNSDVTGPMLESALERAQSLGVEVGRVVHVPGVFDMGPAIRKLLEQPDVVGVAIMGAAIKGETRHDEVVINACARQAADLAVRFGKPVGLGVTGPGMNHAQAVARIYRAANAVEAVVRMARVLEEIEGTGDKSAQG